MNVTLKIENDEELRNFIKEAIRGQVLNIVREDFAEIVKSEVLRKSKSLTKNDIEYLASSAMSKEANRFINEKFDYNVLTKIATQSLSSQLDLYIQKIDFDKSVENAVTMKIIDKLKKN